MMGSENCPWHPLCKSDISYIKRTGNLDKQSLIFYSEFQFPARTTYRLAATFIFVIQVETTIR